MKTMTSAFWLALLLAASILVGTAADAATPPVWVNYQGVLRDAADNPLDGTHDMVFRFYGPSDEEILIDRHTTAQGGAVTVSGGLFNVKLGTGSTADGSGPGTYGSLVEVFRDYNEVHLEVQIGADGAPGTEVLTPRTRVISAAYALNASNLAGVPVTSLLRSNESDAYTFGTLSFGPTTTLDLDGTLNMDGAVTKATTAHVPNFNADLLDGNDATAFAASAHGHTGGEIVGPVGEASSANTLDGHDSTYFLNTSAAAQFKAGPLIVNTDGVPGSTALQAVGEDIGGSFSTLNGTGWAVVGYLDEGISAHGTVQGGFFQDDDGTGLAHVAYGDRGIEASGSEAGGYFHDSDGSGYAYIGYGDYGIEAQGSFAAGTFRATDSSGYAHIGATNVGIDTGGNSFGGYFNDLDESGYAFVGSGHYGIQSHGNSAGGFFEDSDSSGYANVGYGDIGIDARGNNGGGHFSDLDSTAYAYVGRDTYGISAHGSTAGGFFRDSDNFGSAYVGYGDTGIRARGTLAGGDFGDSNSSGYAYVGYGDEGISAHGTLQGGFFQDDDSTGQAHVAYGNLGISASGSEAGGYFGDTGGRSEAYVAMERWGIQGFGETGGAYFASTGYSGYAFVGVDHYGVEGLGNNTGGYFGDLNSSAWSNVGYDTYKVYGVGSVAFVQNHPYEPDKVIAYNAPEGDEVATYTRGSARLIDGEARVALGKTFQWVTNPDIGLTAHVTPRSADAVVYVESVSTTELVVRNVAGFPGDAVFDYLVYGLRIGFEEKSVVQPKQLESYIPSMSGDRVLYEQAPDLRTYNAFERFKGMREVLFLDEAGPLDLSASHALRDAVHEYDPATDPPLGDLAGHGLGRAQERPARPEFPEPEAPAVPEIGSGGDSSTAVVGVPTIPGDEPQRDAELSPAYPMFPVSEPVDVGDLLVMDSERPGRLTRASAAGDPAIVGIVAGESVEGADGAAAPVAGYGFAVVKADAGYGEIRPGDLLTSSFTTGHAMRATEIVPGTIIGKALEPLDAGTGLITVLVMPR